METSELCFKLESVARSWKNRSEIAKDSGEGSSFVVEGKEMVPRRFLQLTSKIKAILNKRVPQILPSTSRCLAIPSTASAAALP